MSKLKGNAIPTQLLQQMKHITQNVTLDYVKSNFLCIVQHNEGVCENILHYIYAVSISSKVFHCCILIRL